MRKPNPLLIKRDKTILVPLEGKVDVDKDMPEPLKTRCYGVNVNLVNYLAFRTERDDLIVTEKNDEN